VIAFIELRTRVGLLAFDNRPVHVPGGGPLHVVGDEQIEVPVAIRIEPRRAHRPAVVLERLAIHHLGPRPAVRTVLDPHESSAVVAQQQVGPEAGDVHVRIVVRVVVGDRDAHAVAGNRQPRRLRHIREDPRTLVAVQPHRRRVALGLPRHRLDEEQIQVPVRVEVEHADTGAHGLRQPLVARGAVDMHEVDARVACDIHEFRERRLLVRARGRLEPAALVVALLLLRRLVVAAGNDQDKNASDERGAFAHRG